MIGGSGRERKARRRQDGDAIQTGCRCITCLDSSNKSINFSPPPPFFWPPLLPPVRPPARPPQVQAHTRSGIFSASAYLQDGACNSLSARPALLGLFYFNPDEKDEEMIKSEGVGGGGAEGGECVCVSHPELPLCHCTAAPSHSISRSTSRW